MALGLKYFARYRDVDGVIKEIRFLKEGYDGASEEWLCTNGAVTFNYAGFDGMFEQPIVTSQAQISFHLTKFYDLSEFVLNRKTFFCEVWNTVTNKIQWTGWVEPWNAERPHRKPPWTVSLNASCGLAHLAKKKYLNTTNVFKKTGLDIIKECLQTISATQPIRISTHLVDTTWGGDDRLGLNSFEINTARYYDQNGEAMYCDVIVNDILNHFNAEIVQDQNRWVIRGVVDNATGLATSYIDLTAGIPADMPFTYVINDEEGSATLEDGTVTILSPINKYRTEIDFGTQMPFFENGNMVLWTEDGLVGWDFTHMSKGNPGWERFETGGETSRGILQINGKSPNPLSKKKKKEKFKILKRLLVLPLIVDALGLVKKGGILDIEPAQYIESSGGVISRGDTSVTVSFEYETEAFSSDILISIRIPITEKKSGKINNFWVDPSQGVALAGADKSLRGATLDFQLIRIPAVDLGELTDKGTIDVSGNPNYPAANFTPGSKQVNWTWTVTGVPSGQSRKIGGINGVIVENGDLIVARVANTGGTQAEVGGSWEVVSIRNNTKKGTFSIPVAINQLINVRPEEPWPADKIYVRFYKMADDPGFPGDWYRVFNLNGALEGFVAKEESARYATTLERGDVTDEEAKTINLISGDYNPWYSGSWTKPGSKENTRSWRRRPDIVEGISIYRAMMLDRLCLTSRPLTVVEGEILIAPGEERLSYLHTIIMHDMNDMRMRITRYSYNDYSRRVRFTAVEVKYEEIPGSELKQDAYIPGSRQLNTIPGQGDGIYPTKQDTTSGRLSAEEMSLSDGALLEALEGSRLGALFDKIPPLIFIAGDLSSQSVNLNNYLSDVVKYNNADSEEEDIFDFNDLRWLVINKPSWVTGQSVVFLDVTVTGRPLYVGDYSITFRVGEQSEEEAQEAIDEAMAEAEANEEEYVPITPFYIDVEIPIQVLPKTKVTYELFDATGEYDLIGAIPGQYPLVNKIDIAAKIAGQHDGWQMTLEGGGATGKQLKKTTSNGVTPTDAGRYFMFAEDSGTDVVAGQYRLFVTTFLDERIVSRQNVNFILYDAEFLNKLKFFLTSGGGDLGEISPDGTSKFIKPGALNIKAVASDVNHDKAVITLYQNEIALKSKTYPLSADSLTGNYLVYDADTELAAGEYNVQIVLSLDGTDVLVRYADFTINEEEPKATSEGLQIGSIAPNTTSFKLIQDLASTGNSLTLPANWTTRNVAVSKPFNSEEWKLLEYKGGSLVEVDIPLYTNEPNEVTYSAQTIESTSYLFRKLNSTKIGKIHKTPSTFRVINTRRLDGATVSIYQADFSFGAVVPIEDVEVTEPGSGIVKLLAGNALNSVIVDSVQTINWQPDNLTLETKQAESPNDPENPLVNVAQIRDKGVTFAKIQDITGKSVIGNPNTVTGVTSAIPITKLGVTPSPGDITSVEYIEDLIESALANYMPLTTVTTGNALPVYFGDVNLYNFTGVALLGASSTNKPNTTPGMLITGVNGANVSQLVVTRSGDNSYYRGTTGGALGTWYQIASRAWVDAKSILTGTGLLGGGTLAADRTLTFDTTWGDARYFVNAATGYAWNGTNVDAKPKFNLSGVDAPAGGGTAYHGIFINHGSNATYGSTIAFRNGVGFYRSVEAGVWGSWLQFADRAWVNAKQINAGNGLTGGGDLSANRTLALGTPSTLDAATTNAVTTTSHTHAITTGSLVQGSNVVLSGTLTNRLIGSGNVTISATAIPWTIVTGKPTSLAGFGILDGVTIGDFNTGLGTKENTFPKGSLVTGNNITFGGDPLNRLVGSGNLVIACNNMPWSDITGKPTTIVGYGITDVYSESQVDALLAGKANSSHTHTSSQITDFTSAVRGSISGSGSISYNATTGVISYTAGAAPVTVVGQAANRTVVYANGGSPAQLTDGHIDDDGVHITFLNPCVIYTGTAVQRSAYANPKTGMLWMQTTAGSGGGGAGLYYCLYIAGVGAWIKSDGSYTEYI